MEKYSVLMTVYTKDNPEYFSLALDSMVNQTYKPDEIVLVKDGPVVEALQEVIDNHLATGAPIVQVQLKKNKGLMIVFWMMFRKKFIQEIFLEEIDSLGGSASNSAFPLSLNLVLIDMVFYFWGLVE